MAYLSGAAVQAKDLASSFQYLQTEVGADRVADVVGTYQIYGGPSILVDFGTHTVFNAISSNGEFLGGSISCLLYTSDAADE